MKMKYQSVIALVGIALLGRPASADLSSVFDGGWRVSAGAVYDSGVKTDMRFTPRQTYVSPFSGTPGAMSRQQAQEAAWGKRSGTRTTYVNGRKGNAKSWVDSKDASSGHDVGHDDGKTTNYRFPAEVWNENTAFELGYADYEEIVTRQISDSAKQSSASDEAAMPGVNVQLSRNLYHDDEHSWGVEVALGFQYAKRNNVFKSSSSWVNGSSTRESGYYASRFRATGDLAELLTYRGADSGYVHDYVWNGDASGEYVGGGGADGFAAPIDLDDIRNEWGGGGSESYMETGALQASGDYSNMELLLLLQPYYDIFSWLSVNATVGMVVSRQSMEMSFSMLRNGVTDYSSNEDFSQWDVYGVAGLGMMLYYKGFTLSGDFLARFLDRDMDVSGSYYSGTVSRGSWMFRLGLGYEF